jgi:hypothetical protein
MPIYDRPSDLQSHNTLPGVGAAGGATYGTTGGGMSPSLTDQTPGLDRASRARNLAMRPVSFVREQPALAASVIGGLIVIGLGTWLALRSRRTSRLERIADDIRCYADEAYGWLRSKVR